jgi:glycosyltransferase involved in cell wall biosynthesis
MRVLVLSHLYPFALAPTFGLFVHNQVKALAERCQVIVLSPTPVSPPVIRRLKVKWAQYASKPDKSELEGITVYYPRYVNIPSEHGYGPGAFFIFLAMGNLVRRLKRSFDFDLIHAHTICLDGPAAVWLGRASGTPVVCTMHGSDINVLPQKSKFTRIIARWAIRNADALVAVSAALKEKALLIGVPKREITVVPNGVDLSQFRPVEQRQVREKLGLPPDKKIIVYVSRLDGSKGLSYLLPAFRTMLERDGNCLLVLVGEGPDRTRLEQQVVQLGLEESVIFAGFSPHNEIPTWINACDLVVHPSLSEGSPLPIYEALACGKPVVASRVGGIPELITSDDYGLLVPPADSGALAGSLLHGLEKVWNSALIQSRGAQYSWDASADRLLDVYQQVLGGVR